MKPALRIFVNRLKHGSLRLFVWCCRNEVAIGYVLWLTLGAALGSAVCWVLMEAGQ